MTKIVFLTCILLSSIFVFSGTTAIQRLDVKVGLWEMTTTSVMTGMPPIPAEALAHMSAEQRARIEASMMNGKPKTETRKECVTKEKLDKDYVFGEDRKNCTRTVVTSTSSKIVMKIHCVEEKGQMNMDGTIDIDALGSDRVKGIIKMAASGGGNNMNVNMEFDGRYLGSSCGDVK
jgi:uncharacterized protein DUF3617